MSEVHCICDFLINRFSNCNPLRLSCIYPQNENNEKRMNFISKVVADDLVLMAFEKLTSTLVGILIKYLIESKPEACVEPFNDSTDHDLTDIENILNYDCAKANIFERFEIEQLFKIEIVCVHRTYRRQKIAKALFESGITCLRINPVSPVYASADSFQLYFTMNITIILENVYFLLYHLLSK